MSPLLRHTGGTELPGLPWQLAPGLSPVVKRYRLLHALSGGLSGVFLTCPAIIAHVSPDVECHQSNNCQQDDYIQVVEDGSQDVEVIAQDNPYVG